MSATSDRAMDNTTSKSRLGSRKFSGTMSRISSSTFSRRRNTTTTLPSSVSSIQLNHQSRLPTPSGIPRSTSFLCSLNHFNHPSIDENQPPQPIEQHRLPERSSQQRSSSRRTSQIPRVASRSGQNPDCTVKIEQRGLMQPMQPPLPRSSTMGHLSSSQSLGVLQENTNAVGTHTERDIRRQSIVLNKRNHTLTPPTIRVKLPKTTPSAAFPKRKDSLMAPPPATAIVAPVKYAAVSEAVAPQRAVSYDEEDTVIISRDSPPKPPPKVKIPTTVRNISHFQEELGETEETDHHHTSITPSTPMPRSIHDYRPHSPPLAPAAYDQDEDPRFVYHAQQPTYWLGRYTALSDIFHTSALPEPIPTTINPKDRAARMPMPFSSAASSSSDILDNGSKHPMQDRTTRLQHVRMQLRLSCVTEDAIQSFRLFEEMMEEVVGEPEKQAPRASAGVKEKKGWLEGLMARRKSGNLK